MIYKFNNIFQKEVFNLPIINENDDFESSLNKRYDEYVSLLKENEFSDTKEIEKICENIIDSIRLYHNGFPHKAFYKIKEVMKEQIEKPLKIYKKNMREGEFFIGGDPLKLFRIRKIEDINKKYGIEDIFHVPYNQREKISSTRYSILGYPSLYLSTSLELCKYELYKPELERGHYMVSQFLIERNIKEKEVKINVLELAIKPQDFFDNKRDERFDEVDLDKVKIEYFNWYPIILACSFVRKNKKDPFASEYIIPQLIMQYLRYYYEDKKTLMGIRYFSCASEEASKLGFNYVFPVSGKKVKGKEFCNILAETFKISQPKVLEFGSEEECMKDVTSDLKIK